ncbi:MAG: hypothetical protein ABJO02_04325 [Reichenbachiella sp.]|uniref:hypothetical protein n=1 Tax=Reichenbachiella sp. TaxID=2184521 RepID=UPI00329958EC
MKNIFRPVLFTILFFFIAGSLVAQSTFKEAKKNLKQKAIKEARKEAKKWEKKGFSNLPGDPPLDKQFEVSMIKQFMLDEKGDPLYIVTNGSAIAGSEGVAAANAMDNSRAALAGQIQSEVSALVSNNKANTQYEDGQVETIDEFLSNSKTLIQKELGALKPAIRMYRSVDTNVEFRYSIIYSIETAKNVTKKILKDELQEKLDPSDEQLNKLLDL